MDLVLIEYSCHVTSNKAWTIFFSPIWANQGPKKLALFRGHVLFISGVWLALYSVGLKIVGQHYTYIYIYSMIHTYIYIYIYIWLVYIYIYGIIKPACIYIYITNQAYISISWLVFSHLCSKIARSSAADPLQLSMKCQLFGSGASQVSPRCGGHGWPQG